MTTTKPFLTIGMATYDDYHGVYFTIQHLRLMFPDLMPFVEFIVVDNHPDSDHGRAVAQFLTAVANSRYLPFSEYNSTSVRELIFQQAQGEFVMCMDCHVLLTLNSLQRLFAWFKDHETENVMVQGPLWEDALTDNLSTHFDPEWRAEMWGIWATDMRGVDENSEPFPITMQGLGLFAMKKEFWPGLNPLFRGFGGEEGYIHEKVRQRGGRCLCLPFLRWVHRFDRPGGAPYSVTTDDRIRNYLLGHIELGLPIDPILEYFKDRQSPHRIMMGAKEALGELIKSNLVPPDTKIRMIKVYQPKNRLSLPRSPARAATGNLSATYL